MNRLDHAIANMQNVATNLSMAKGRIEDADFAAETSNLFEGPSLTASKHGDVSAGERIETKYSITLSIEFRDIEHLTWLFDDQLPVAILAVDNFFKQFFNMAVKYSRLIMEAKQW